MNRRLPSKTISAKPSTIYNCNKFFQSPAINLRIVLTAEKVPSNPEIAQHQFFHTQSKNSAFWLSFFQQQMHPVTRTVCRASVCSLVSSSYDAFIRLLNLNSYKTKNSFISLVVNLLYKCYLLTKTWRTANSSWTKT